MQAVRIEYRRDSDAMNLLAQNETDLIFIGDDKLTEKQLAGELRAVNVVDTVPIDCRFVLAGLKSRVQEIPTMLGRGELLTVSTSYPATLGQFALKNGLNLAVTRVTEGGCEADAKLGRTDLIFDIMKTGNSIRSNDLVVYRREPDLNLNVIRSIDLAANDPTELAAALEMVAKTYFQRLRSGRMAPMTYTESLLQDENKLVKKIGEEFGELLQSLLRTPQDKTEIINESADLLYALGLFLTKRGVRMTEVLAEDIKRNQGDKL